MRYTILIVAIVLLAACNGKRESPHETIQGKDLSVTYGRPFKKDRVIFGDLVKYGQVWRTGADEATEITFNRDARFNGQPVKAGTYTLFTIPDRSEWTIILNSQLKQSGAFDYEEHKDKDVLHTKVPAQKTDAVVEQFTIRFAPDNSMIIEWDQTQVQIPITL